MEAVARRWSTMPSGRRAMLRAWTSLDSRFDSLRKRDEEETGEEPLYLAEDGEREQYFDSSSSEDYLDEADGFDRVELGQRSREIDAVVQRNYLRELL